MHVEEIGAEGWAKSWMPQATLVNLIHLTPLQFVLTTGTTNKYSIDKSNYAAAPRQDKAREEANKTCDVDGREGVREN